MNLCTFTYTHTHIHYIHTYTHPNTHIYTYTQPIHTHTYILSLCNMTQGRKASASRSLGVPGTAVIAKVFHTPTQQFQVCSMLLPSRTKELAAGPMASPALAKHWLIDQSSCSKGDHRSWLWPRLQIIAFYSQWLSTQPTTYRPSSGEQRCLLYINNVTHTTSTKVCR